MFCKTVCMLSCDCTKNLNRVRITEKKDKPQSTWLVSSTDELHCA